MIRALLYLGSLVLLLGVWNALLAARETRARSAANRVGALFSAEEAESLRRQPALRIEMAGETHAYGRLQGQWRCLSYHQAPADGRALQALLDGLAHAEGLVHAREVAEAPAYGINTPETIRIALQGPRAMQDPGGDVRATIEIGKSQPERDACFVRRQGTKEIWAIAGDLRAALAPRVAPGLPPLLEAGVVPSAWLEQSGGAVEIAVERAQGGFTLVRRDRPLDPPTAQPGDLPWSWILAPGAEEHELPAAVAASYTTLVERLPYTDVLDPARRDALDLARPHVTVSLRAREGAPLRLAFGVPGADGRVPLWVEASGTLYLVEARLAALVAPESAELANADAKDERWSAALRTEER